MTGEDRFNKLISELQSYKRELEEDRQRELREAYDKGWNDACNTLIHKATNAVEQAIEHMLEDAEEQIKRSNIFSKMTSGTRTVRRGAVLTAVRQTVRDQPGMTGVEIVAAVNERGSFKERSVRTALRRLRLDGEISQRDGRWYWSGRQGDILGALDQKVSSKEETAETPSPGTSAVSEPQTQEDQMDPP